jgi:cellulose synthase operon protein C
MAHLASRQSTLSVLLIAALLGPSAEVVRAVDESPAGILAALRAKGHFKEAIEYLEHARTDPNTPKAILEAIDYELAVTRIDAAERMSESQREELLIQAQKLTAKYLADHPQHIRVAEARSQFSNLLFERGRLQRILAEPYEGQSRQKRMEAARELLHQADKSWDSVDQAAGEELKLPVVVRDDRAAEIKRSETLDRIRRRQLQARLARAWVQYELAQTFLADTSDRTTAVQEAGKAFDTIHEQQRERLAGFYARLGRGLCCKDLGESDKAFAIFEELLALPDDLADFHALRGKAAVQALEISLQPQVKKYKQGLDIARKWIEVDPSPVVVGDAAPASRGIDLAVRFLGAEAALAYLKTLPPINPEQSDSRVQLVDWSRQQFTLTAAAAGPYQAKAKIRLLDESVGKPNAKEPGTFADARDRAKAALDQFLYARAEHAEAARSGVRNDRDSQRQRQQQIATAKNETLKYCRLALEMPAAAAAGEYDTIRYYLAYLHYVAGELEEAAAIGERLAAASGDSPAVRQTARIALAAREALLRRTTEDSLATAIERVQVLAEKIVQRWSDRAEADDARGILLDLALADGQLEKAGQYLKEISGPSPRRGEAELSLGRALWSRATFLARTSTLEHNHDEEAEKITARAAEMLADGIERYRKLVDTGKASRGPLPHALLALAQVNFMQGRLVDAIALLEDPSIRNEDSSCLALLAYVSTSQFEKAKRCLEAIHESLPTTGNAHAAQQTLQACIRVQRLLKHHLANSRQRRQDELLEATVKGFDTFLTSLGPETKSEGFFASAWRAEAYFGLAAGLDQGGPAVLPPAEMQYRRAAAAFQETLDRALREPGFSPAVEVTSALRIELARCLRRLSDTQAALSQLEEVLKDHPRMVDAQIEAAYIYQSWGDEKPEYLEMAIQGDSRHYEVWGWGQLARRVQPETRFRNVFHEARYNLALCRLRQAQTATDRSRRSKLAERAENDIRVTRQLFPDMGGVVWYDKYNELLKRIQRMADRPAVGLSDGK